MVVSEVWLIIECFFVVFFVEQYEVVLVDELGWCVCECCVLDGMLIDCFVEVLIEGDMFYVMEVFGDDYIGYGGIECKYEYCKMIVGWVNVNWQFEL